MSQLSAIAPFGSERRIGAFANREHVVQSWYAAMPSGRLRRGQVRSFQLGGRRIAIYRDSSAGVHAMDARCPHLGADLGQGRVENDSLRCAFHGWCFGPDGRCQSAPGYTEVPARRIMVYPIQERWGFVWVFNGPRPPFDLPGPADADAWSWFRLPGQQIRCHPHLVLANGLDVGHYGPLHGLAFTAPPRLSIGGRYEIALEIRARPRSRAWQLVTGTRRRDVAARFATIGGSLAWTSVFEPLKFHVLFTGRPDRQGHCLTQTFFFFPRGSGISRIRALGLMALLLGDDRRVLDTIDFTGDFTERDEALRAYATLVNGLDTW